MIAHLDCSSGISGDKFLGALIDAGFDADELRAALGALGAGEVALSVLRVERGGIAAASVRVTATDEPPSRRWLDIRTMLEGAAIPVAARDRALAAFTLLAEVESRVHGVDADEVHFHELGAVDTIADIVGVAMGLDALGIDELVCTPVAVGSGTVEISHGVVPVPAPATGELLVGVPAVPGPASGELTTPTGAALVRAFASSFGPMPAMTPTATGFGAGARELSGVPNVARIVVGEPLAVPADAVSAAGAAAATGCEPVVILETNIDHISAEQLAFCAEELLADGALDVWQTPIVMKKGRAAVMLSVLATPADAERLSARTQRLTGTLGVRLSHSTRTCVQREIVQVESAWGPVHVKVSGDGDDRIARPEHDDIARIARETGLAYAEVRDRIIQGLPRDETGSTEAV